MTTKVIDPAEQKRAEVFEAHVAVKGDIKFAVNGDGEIVFADLRSITIAGIPNVTTERASKWAENNGPIITAWMAKLIVAGIEDAKRDFDNRGVITPKVPVKG